MTKKELAVELHDSGCNCAQSVVSVFCAEAGADEETMRALTQRYGHGAYKYCGAVMAAVTAMNMLQGDLNPEDPASFDGAAADKVRSLLRRFEEKNGSVFCRELKGIDTGIMLRSCNGCIEDAVEITEDILKNGAKAE